MLQSVGCKESDTTYATDSTTILFVVMGAGLGQSTAPFSSHGPLFPCLPHADISTSFPHQTSLNRLEDSHQDTPPGLWGCGGPQALPPSPTVPSPAPRDHVSSGLQSWVVQGTQPCRPAEGASVQSDFPLSSQLPPLSFCPSHPFLHCGLGPRPCVCTRVLPAGEAVCTCLFI